MRDMDIMFNNAMAYNTDESQIYKDAVHLQVSDGSILASVNLLIPAIRLKRTSWQMPKSKSLIQNTLWKMVDYLFQGGFCTTGNCGRLETGFIYKIQMT